MFSEDILTVSDKVVEYDIYYLHKCAKTKKNCLCV